MVEDGWKSGTPCWRLVVHRLEIYVGGWESTGRESMLEVVSSHGESVLEAGSRQVGSLCWRLVVHRLEIYVGGVEFTGWESMLEAGNP